MKRENRVSASRRRVGQRGAAEVQEILALAAILSLFVWPLAMAVRSVGRGMAEQMDHAERVLLGQE